MTFPAILGFISDTVENQTDNDGNGTQNADYDNLQVSEGPSAGTSELSLLLCNGITVFPFSPIFPLLSFVILVNALIEKINTMVLGVCYIVEINFSKCLCHIESSLLICFEN